MSFVRSASLLLCLLLLSGCPPREAKDRTGAIELVFRNQPLLAQSQAFEALLREFEAKNPGVSVRIEPIPNSSDLAHQFFLTALEGESDDFDLFILDVIWVAEFTRAGWMADLSEAFPPEQIRSEFLPGAADAVIIGGRTMAIPWYVDVGLLYTRTDLVPHPPRTYAELIAFAKAAREKDPALAGYVWQGRQYEGLSCNAFEAIWGHGGEPLEGDRILLETEEAEAGLAYLRELLVSGVSPPSTLSAAEEESRRVFQAGRAVFMRNWPYAWAEAQAPGSPIRGKVAATPLPTLSGEPGAGTLGGWQIALNVHARPAHRKAALALIAHLTSEEANLMLATDYGRNPARRSLYDSEALKRRAPFIAGLRDALSRARARPKTPYYNLLSDTLQGEFSAAISGVRSPERALERAQQQVDRMVGSAR